MKARKEWRTDKGERIWVVLGPVEAIDHSNYPLFSSNKAGTLRQSSGRSSLLLFSKIQFHSSLLCLLHIKHFLQLFLFHSYLDYLTPQPIQSDCSFHQTLLESIPGSFQMGWLRLWVCERVCTQCMQFRLKTRHVQPRRRRVIWFKKCLQMKMCVWKPHAWVWKQDYLRLNKVTIIP